MKIHATDRIADVQDRFQALFPLLQLRFYCISHEPGQSSAHRDEIPDNQLILTEFNPDFKAGEIVLDEQTTAGQLETNFASAFGLYVQVYRKAGKHWIQTTNTDEWPLSRQQAVAADTAQFFDNIRR